MDENAPNLFEAYQQYGLGLSRCVMWSLTAKEMISNGREDQGVEEILTSSANSYDLFADALFRHYGSDSFAEKLMHAALQRSGERLKEELAGVVNQKDQTVRLMFLIEIGMNCAAHQGILEHYKP
ncbi:MAG: hypothetical protein NXH95_00745 [Pseudomonadaceae bacterium]|nr:hypothetical protein [Pseudomonadaceae bacterium]